MARIPDLQRLLEIALVDTLALDNSIARSRALAYLVQTALKLQQAGELEERLRALEAAVGTDREHLRPLFDCDPSDLDELGDAA